MELKLYDTLTREKRAFRPIDPARVRMYVCGPTVYDFAHIGNARPVIVFDVLFRVLRHLYGADHVTYVRNITDVDDKINARAAERGVSIRQVTEETYADFKADVAALGCLPPTVEPRATDHIDEMKTLIERLVQAGCAYVAEGHVLFSVASMEDYGKLSNRSLDEMIAGARVEVAPFKKDATDFVLWKPSKDGEPSWSSPCGIAAPGRPGWHIECSAMAWKHLGETFDIHGGGIDLVFPHHENEIAQSRCAFHTDVMANYWLHNGFLQVEGEKMSKSTGNFVTVHELLSNWCGYSWPGDALRFNMLRTHYRQPIDWTFQGLDQAHKVLWDWYEYTKNSTPSADPPQSTCEILCDDLNTPALIALLHDFKRRGRPGDLLASLNFLGFSGQISNLHRARLPLPPLPDTSSFDVAAQVAINAFRQRQIAAIQASHSFSGNITTPVPENQTIERLISQRNEARAKKDFKESDRIRDELAKMGVVLKDSKDGTTWEIAR